ncbi:Zinc finger protein [Plakobranchus ocellatus]|uniref:Zinc finger protein n=1 Tax=Plakobranchus ocellatus TaxID=259542 RepID=A0AAV4BCE3_9GAST|nr:Zinc finger protein [Plakobranchus ocellatus]
MATMEEIVKKADLLGYRGEKREEYLKQEFKLLEERQEKKEEAERQEKKEEAERQEKKEEAERQAREKKEEAERTVPRVPLEKVPLIDTPFKRVAMDLIGPINPPSEAGHRFILTLVDYATRFAEAVPLRKIDTESVAEALVDIYSRPGVPEEMLSDQGMQFISDCMKEELEKAQGRQKHYYDRTAKCRKFSVGDKVLVLLPTNSNKLLMQWKGPFEIVATVGVNDYRINMGGKEKTFHAGQATMDERPPTSSSAIPAASVTVIEDLEGEHFNDSECEALPELGGWGSEESVNDLKYGNGLTQDQRRQLEEVAVTYSSIFSDRPGTASTEEHCIELTSSIPVRQRPYPVPYAMRQTLRDELREMDDLGVIRKSSSPYASPVVVVKKKDGTNRVCIDYRRLNKLTIFDPQPMTPPVDIFQGLVGYYKEFVPNFAAVSAPLSDLVRKGQPNIVNWGDSQERAYNSLKVAVTSKPVLQLPDVNKKVVLRTDASDRGLGAALMQENEGTLFPVAYASKKLSDRERKYSVTEREAFAIVWGVKKFSLYLYGTVFTLQTDHGALQFLNASKFDSPRIMRWALALQVYNFDVQYIKGSENVGADYLSRIE